MASDFRQIGPNTEFEFVTLTREFLSAIVSGMTMSGMSTTPEISGAVEVKRLGHCIATSRLLPAETKTYKGLPNSVRATDGHDEIIAMNDFVVRD